MKSSDAVNRCIRVVQVSVLMRVDHTLPKNK